VVYYIGASVQLSLAERNTTIFLPGFLLAEEGKGKKMKNCGRDSSLKLKVLALHYVPLVRSVSTPSMMPGLPRKCVNSKDSFIYGFADFFR